MLTIHSGDASVDLSRFGNSAESGIHPDNFPERISELNKINAEVMTYSEPFIHLAALMMGGDLRYIRSFSNGKSTTYDAAMIIEAYDQGRAIAIW